MVGSQRYKRGALVTIVVVALTGVLFGGSLPQGQAQATDRLDLKRQMKLATPAPEESSSDLGGFSAAGTDPGLESGGVLANVQASRTMTGTLVNVVTPPTATHNPPNTVVGQRLTDCVRVGASETTIAQNSDGLVVGFNNAFGFAGHPFLRGSCSIMLDGLSGFAFSTNGGAKWTDGGVPPVGNVIAFGPGTEGCSASGRFVTRGDPWLDTDGKTFIYVSLAQWFDNGETAAFPCFAPAAGSVPTAGMSVHFGTFHDGTFSWDNGVLLQSPNYPGDFLDKEAFAVDPESSGAIYITVTNFIKTCGLAANGFGQIELYRSLNGGATWHRRIVQRDETFVTDRANPACGLDGIQNQGSVPLVGPGGELMVAWERGWLAPVVGAPPQGLPRATIAFKMTTDRGEHFGPLRTITSICSDGFLPPAGYNRTLNNDFPRIAVARGGPFAGRIFVTFQDCSATNGNAPFGRNTDVYLAFSDDFGAHWTINPVHPVADGKIHFFPVVSVDTSGHVRVAYYESQEVLVGPNACSVRVGGPLNDPILRKSARVSMLNVKEAVSTDGGQTFTTPRLVTTQTTNLCKATPLNSGIPNIGDYNGSHSGSSTGLNIWADGRNGTHVDFVPTVFFEDGAP